MGPEPKELPWLASLSDAAAYPHPAERIEILHTHLSVVALAGPYVYKLKKPVDYGFVDFSTPEKRRHFCETELRLNRRFAAPLYLDLVPLVRTPDGWRFGASGPAVEYAVRMRRFRSEDRLDRVAERGGLTDSLLDVLAARIARFHETAEPAAEDRARGYPARLASAIENNFKALPESALMKSLRESFEVHRGRHAGLLDARAAAGRVRDCHGDLHLANLCLWEGEPLPFDCIEFNDDLRIIDVLSDTAFLYMDLLARGFPEAARRVLSLYLEATGDYAGLPAWPLFVGYRAHVRAKIEHLTSVAVGTPPEDRAAHESRREEYLKLAAAALSPSPGRIVLAAGLPGSGKSTVALRIACRKGGLRVRSDVERKRLHRKDPSRELYGSDLGQETYRVLLDHARAIVASGQVAILDATYLRRAYRQPVRDLARELGVPLSIVHCEAPLEVLCERVRARRVAGADPSDADEAVLLKMANQWEPFTEEERALVRVESSA